MKRILITGASGLLGRSLIYENSKKNKYEIIGIFYPKKKYKILKFLKKKYFLNLLEQEKVEKICKKEKIDFIINTASIGIVDYVEKHKREAKRNNFGIVKNLVKICKKDNIKLIHLSSNAVYDGNFPLYNEESEQNPINYYGKLKKLEEEYIKTELENYLIIRPILMYGWNEKEERDNPLTWQIKMMKNNKPIKMVNDIYCNPLLANDCAKFILKIIEKYNKEDFNIAGPEIMSRFEMAKRIAKFFKRPDYPIEPVPNSFFKEIAPRPKDTCFDITKALKTGYKPMALEQGLKYLMENKF